MNAAIGGAMPDSTKPSSEPLDYERPPDHLQGNRRQFWTALVAGSVCSLIFWIIFMVSAGGMGRPLVAIFVFLAAKLVVGIGLSLSNQWKLAGRGLFISLGVGALILLGTCGIAVLNSWG
jgi:hypothetical protein